MVIWLIVFIISISSEETMIVSIVCNLWAIAVVEVIDVKSFTSIAVVDIKMMQLIKASSVVEVAKMVIVLIVKSIELVHSHSLSCCQKGGGILHVLCCFRLFNSLR